MKIILYLLSLKFMVLRGVVADNLERHVVPPEFVDNGAVFEAVEVLERYGFRICAPEPFEDIPLCDFKQDLLQRRSLLEEPTEGGGEKASEAPWYINLAGAFVCVVLAAIAAGLTLGLLGMDPLMLLIKERAGETEKERQIASRLLPIVRQHHRLLVTLLLMNAVANEALPIFLESLVPPSVAILVSVTLVLFFGEIIPSAIFTGPNQLQIADSLVPLVRMSLFLLYPLAGPIAALLDYLLHDEEDVAAYNRGELSALIRINYEQRLAQKRRRKPDKMALVVEGERVGALDFTSSLNRRKSSSTVDAAKSIRALKNQLERTERSLTDERQNPVANTGRSSSAESFERRQFERSPSIHVDEVLMVEGALQMKTKTAMDIFTALRKVFSVAIDLELNERSLVSIYASGFTRVPVHVPGDKSAICGLLMTKQLIVVSAKDKRTISTLPLRIPHCVSPAIPLVNLLNLLQTGGTGGTGGHMALVCARPHAANMALAMGQEVPETAGLMGIITLEDVLEALLQEQIYDEMDKGEREATRLATAVIRQWRKYVKAKKTGKLEEPPKEPAMVSIVQEAVMVDQLADERTGLLP